MKVETEQKRISLKNAGLLMGDQVPCPTRRSRYRGCLGMMPKLVQKAIIQDSLKIDSTFLFEHICFSRLMHT
jgi:hypothetical protein